MPEYDKAMTLRNERYSKLPQPEKDKIMAHQMQHAENKELDINKVRKRLQEEKRIRKRMQRKEKKMLKCTSELY
jgi:predicted metallopeptidase